MRKDMKKLISAICILTASLSLCACSEKEEMLSGTYVGESGVYSIELSEDGTCTWYDDGTAYEGNYEKEEDYWKVYLDGYIDYPEEVMDVQLVMEEDGTMMAYSVDFMEEMTLQE